MFRRGASYDHLPVGTAELLNDWHYKGVRPYVADADGIVPTVAFSTVDLKLPAKGPAKILEFNGYDSGLDGYPEENRHHTLIGRANAVVDSLGIPVARYRWEYARKRYVEIGREIHPLDAEPESRKGASLEQGFGGGFSVLESDLIRGWLEQRRAQNAKGGFPKLEPHFPTLEEAPVLIELSDPSAFFWKDFDPEDALIANPVQIRLIEEDKIALSFIADAFGLQRYRPAHSTFFPLSPGRKVKNDLRENPHIDKLVLKYPQVDAGQGVTVMHRDEFLALSRLAERIGNWPAMLMQLGGNGLPNLEEFDRFSKNVAIDKQLLVEEYVPSKPVEDAEGRFYDATMRVVISSLGNRGKLTIVPVGAYWKLPVADMHHTVNEGDSHISRIKDGGSLPVSEADFKRAFRDVARFARPLLINMRSSSELATRGGFLNLWAGGVRECLRWVT